MFSPLYQCSSPSWELEGPVENGEHYSSKVQGFNTSSLHLHHVASACDEDGVYDDADVVMSTSDSFSRHFYPKQQIVQIVQIVTGYIFYIYNNNVKMLCAGVRSLLKPFFKTLPTVCIRNMQVGPPVCIRYMQVGQTVCIRNMQVGPTVCIRNMQVG